MKRKTIPCPQCLTESEWSDNQYRPFCSERCRLIDLGSWADDSYRIPTVSIESIDNVIPFPQAGPEEEQ